MSRLRRYGFLATIAIGMALLGASFHGLTSVDRELKIAAATPAPASAPELVRDEGRGRDCDKPRGREHRQLRPRTRMPAAWRAAASDPPASPARGAPSQVKPTLTSPAPPRASPPR